MSYMSKNDDSISVTDSKSLLPDRAAFKQNLSLILVA